VPGAKPNHGTALAPVRVQPTTRSCWTLRSPAALHPFPHVFRRSGEQDARVPRAPARARGNDGLPSPFTRWFDRWFRNDAAAAGSRRTGRALLVVSGALLLPGRLLWTR